MAITRFRELRLPQPGIHAGNDVWFVHTKIASPFYLTNDGTYHLADLLTNSDRLFYFKTLREAHRHACEYYTKHGEPYPYFIEYRKASANTNGSGNDNDIHSQQMVFN